jgi:hypothetical protein
MSKTNANGVTIHNNTDFTPEQITNLVYVGETRNNWRQCNIKLYAHPTEPEGIISVGTTFCGTAIVIAHETRADWRRALEAIANGRMHVEN